HAPAAAIRERAPHVRREDAGDRKESEHDADLFGAQAARLKVESEVRDQRADRSEVPEIETRQSLGGDAAGRHGAADLFAVGGCLVARGFYASCAGTAADRYCRSAGSGTLPLLATLRSAARRRRPATRDPCRAWATTRSR